jgi:hypothetical protein
MNRDQRPNSRDGPLEIDYASLLEKAADGDDRAWEALVRALAPRIHALIVANTRDDELAEEITQSVFVTVSQRVNDYVEQGRFEAWVFRIAMNRQRPIKRFCICVMWQGWDSRKSLTCSRHQSAPCWRATFGPSEGSESNWGMHSQNSLLETKTSNSGLAAALEY